MKFNSAKKEDFSRRQVLPFIGFSLLIPFLGFSKSKNQKTTTYNKEDYRTLLKSDGTIVHVKESSLKNVKILKKNISNNSFLNWLGRKL
tara:strand:- start:384 stop:650 length:267 start_codon:yes stop_codon:yes gene_type:complete